jgi:hypothetical protein
MSAILTGHKTYGDHQNAGQQWRGDKVPYMGLAVDWGIGLLAEGVVVVDLGSPVAEASLAAAVMRARALESACILIDASDREAGPLAAESVLGEWACLAPGLPAVVLVDPEALEQMWPAVEARSRTGQVIAVCVDAERAEEKAVEFGRLWRGLPGAATRAAKSPLLRLHTPDASQSRPVWRQAASQGSTRVH